MPKKIKKTSKKKVIKKNKKIKKKIVKKSLSKKKIPPKKVKKIIKKRDGKLVGRVKHFFSNIKVAVIRFSAPVKVGDQIRITGGEDTDFTQKITSMQFDHKIIKMAKKGKEVGMKVSKKVREGYKVFNV